MLCFFYRESRNPLQMEDETDTYPLEKRITVNESRIHCTLKTKILLKKNIKKLK